MIPHQTSVRLGTTSKNGLRRARFRVRWNGQHNEFATTIPYLIDQERWIVSESRCKKNSFHDGVTASMVNRLVEKYESAAREVMTEFFQNGVVPTNEEFKRAFVRLTSPEQEKTDTVADILVRYIKEQRVASSWSHNTIQNKQSLLANVKTYMPDATLSCLSESSVLRFVQQLINDGYVNETIKKKLRQFSAFVNWANKKELCSVDTSIFSLHLKSPDELKEAIIYLDWSELMSVYDISLSGVYAEVRDMFCFGCFTGLRYSDIVKVRQKHIYNEAIHIITEKTSKPTVIELNDYSRTIVERHRNNDPESPLFFPHPNQVCNRYVKDIAKKAGVCNEILKVCYNGNRRIEETMPKYEALTMHAARRTFVVTALTLGIEPSIIMRWTGHRNYETMKPYIAIVETAKRAAMDKFNKRP